MQILGKAGGMVRGNHDFRDVFRSHDDFRVLGRLDEAIAPALRNRDMLAVASDDYLRLTIRVGRSGTSMPAWADEGRLSGNDIDQLVAHLRSSEGIAPSIEGISAARGNVRHGRMLYRSRCAGCHGREGLDRIGVSLDSPSLLAVASDEFLARTIVRGRSNTAMPSWKQLSADSVSDLLAHIRSWEEAAADKRQAKGDPSEERTGTKELSMEQLSYVRRLRDRGPSAIGDRVTGSVEKGRALYAFACAECHGANGEGLSGSALGNPDFLRSASDRFILMSIVVGRDGTPMRPDIAKILSAVTPGDTRTALDDIVAFIRHWERYPPIAGIPARYVLGADVAAGKGLYASFCAACHATGGSDGWAPALSNHDFLATANDGFLQATVVRGRAGTAMRSFAIGSEGIGELKSGQINEIVAHLRTWARPENRPAKWR